MTVHPIAAADDDGIRTEAETRGARCARVLFVDDDELLLKAIARSVRGSFDVEVASSAEVALAKLRAFDHYHVLVTDLRMSRMDGLSLLQHAQQISPRTRLMLFTGTADLQTALRSINEYRVSRILTKPCKPDVVTAALRDAISQHDEEAHARELSQRTLAGCIESLGELMAMTCPRAHARALRVRESLHALCRHRGTPVPPYLDTAAFLSQLGLATLPPQTAERWYVGAELTHDERILLDDLPSRVARIVRHLPGIEKVLETLLHLDRDFKPADPRAPGPWGLEIPEGARLLRILVRYDVLVSAGCSPRRALLQLGSERDRFDPRLLEEFMACEGEASAAQCVRHVALAELQVGMTLAEDVTGMHGVLLLGRGQTVSVRALGLIREYYANSSQPVRLRVMNADEDLSDFGVRALPGASAA